LRDVPVDFAGTWVSDVRRYARETTVVSELWSSLKSGARTVRRLFPCLDRMRRESPSIPKLVS
jgi:hypothetical protein